MEVWIKEFDWAHGRLWFFGTNGNFWCFKQENNTTTVSRISGSYIYVSVPYIINLDLNNPYQSIDKIFGLKALL